jgi:precorrin-6B C5,15-methyltransferase / cobalt-precorrin-6B C5,C15-methyltransferase
VTLPVHLLGIGAEGVEGLQARAREALASATFVAGGSRHLALVEPKGVETFAIADNLADLSERLGRRPPEERCVVLASGDPLFYGIGSYLREHLGPGQLVVVPSLSSMQLAFARAALPWNGAKIASIHGRPLDRALLPLLGEPVIGLFTHDGTSPARIAAFFLDRGLDDYRAWVCEDLGSDGERVTELDLSQLRGREFGPLNVVLLERREGVIRNGLGLSVVGWGATPPALASSGGVAPHPTKDRAEKGQRSRQSGMSGGTTDHAVPPDGQFARPESGPVLLTHADVRAMVLRRFDPLPEGPLWDLGAGLGGVSIGLARQFRGRDVVAVERSGTHVTYLEENRRRFGAWNLRVIQGEAPEALAAEEVPPAGVFLGGSGGRLDPILGLVSERLRAGGVFVANFVGLENLARCLEALKGRGWPSEVSQAQISHGEPLAGLTALAPQRPVWIVRATRP